jgi:hypothetical protein
LGLIGYALYSWFFVGRTPQGWTSLMVAITFLGSIQLLVLGIHGQYLGRMHDQVRSRPLFIVDSVHRADPSAVGHSPQPSASAAPRPSSTDTPA